MVHDARDHDCNLGRTDSCMDEFETQIREDERQHAANQIAAARRAGYALGRKAFAVDEGGPAGEQT